MVTRREILVRAGGGVLAAGGLMLPGWARAAVSLGPPDLPEGTLSSAVLEALPGKKQLIKRSFRPPNYETPVEAFAQPFTPNDQFFVRYHLSNIPEVPAESWRLRVGGPAAQTPAEFTLDELRREFPTVELAAVCQCSGNRRGLANPHVTGVEWGYGAMGNALWTGVRLKDVLNKVGVAREAVEIAFDGADSGVVEKTPDFVKSLPVWKALDENTLIAFAMNGEPLPHWNGFPARLIVPGWTATYWMKHLVDIRVLAEPETNYWMKSAYRLPLGKFPVVDRFTSQETAVNTPITEMVVNSLVVAPQAGSVLKAGEATEVRGIAWDGGYGIARVELSADGGRSWQDAALGQDLGRYAWRPWSHRFTPQAGAVELLVRATNRIGQTQTDTPIWNPAGYHHNAVQRLSLKAV